jgi:uncharacterized metal-binding protein YceD (DUF177 family)
MPIAAMSRPELVIPVADLDRGAKHVELALSEAWLTRALEGTFASVVAPGKAEVTVSKNGPSVLVRGQLSVDLTLPCVVTLDPVPVPVRAEILLMLEPAAGAGNQEARSPRPRPPRAPRPESAKLAAKPTVDRAVRPKKSDKSEAKWDETPILTDEDAGRDTYEGHEIVLDHFIREFIILELPMFPRRSDLPIDPTAANPPLPADSQPGGDKPLDPRLSPLAELKSRLEKINKE